MAFADEDDDTIPSTRASPRMDSVYVENERLRKDLEDCRDQLFRILQKGNDTPESVINNAFKVIYSGIDGWVDEVFCEDSAEELFKTQFVGMVHNRRKFSIPGLHPRCYSDLGWLVNLSKSRYCLHTILSLAISDFLTNEIFRVKETNSWGNHYPHGLLESEIVFILKMQDKMKEELKKDDSEISKWRGQTISAYLSFDEAKTRAGEASQRHFSTLKRNVEDWLGKKLSESLSDSLMDHVILRATRALDTICCSNKTYIVIGSDLISPGPLDESTEFVDYKDMKSWRATPSSRIVDILQCLYPGVLRMGEGGQDDLLLVQPTCLGYEEPGQLPLASQFSSMVRPPDKKSSKRKGNEKTDSLKAQSTKKSWLPTKWSFNKEGGHTKSGNVIPRKVTVDSSSRRGRSSQHSPGNSYVPNAHLDTRASAYVTSDLQSSYNGHSTRKPADMNDEGDQDSGNHSRRASTMKW